MGKIEDVCRLHVCDERPRRWPGRRGFGQRLRLSLSDVDLYVPSLVSGIFGTLARMASELARLAGRTKSPQAPTEPREGGRAKRR